MWILEISIVTESTSFTHSSDLLPDLNINDYSNNLWMYYDGPRHPIVQQMIDKTLSTTSRNWNTHFLTSDNISQFVDETTLPKKFSWYSSQNQADLLRLILLYKYGGWWMDATTIVNADEFMIEARQQLISSSADFFGYCWLQCPKTLIENNVMYAKRHSSFVEKWESEYKNALAIGREEYIYRWYRNGTDFASQLFVQYPLLNVYFTAYAAQRVAMTRIIPRSTKIQTVPAEQYIYKLMVACNWDAKCLGNILPYELQSGTYPITKIPSLNRRQVWPGTGAPPRRRTTEPIYKLTGIKIDDNMALSATVWVVIQISHCILLIATLYLEGKQARIKRKEPRLLL